MGLILSHQTDKIFDSCLSYHRNIGPSSKRTHPFITEINYGLITVHWEHQPVRNDCFAWSFRIQFQFPVICLFGVLLLYFASRCDVVRCLLTDSTYVNVDII